MKIAVYCRKSVFTGKGESIGNQKEICKNYINSKYKDAEIKIYEDEGFSAKSMERPQFKRLLKDVRSGAVQGVVCYRLDRVSRSVSDFASLTEEFIKLGVFFASVKEEFDTGTPMGKAMMYIASVFAQLERETIAERVKDNMRLLSKTGRWLGGTAPTGYKSEKYEAVQDGKSRTFFRLCEVPEESRTVKLIFSLFLCFKSVSKVRQNLLKSGVKTRFGKDFSATAIKEILKNPVYAACDGDTYEYFIKNGAEVTFDKNDFGKAIMPYGRRRGKTGAADTKEHIIAAGEHPFFVTGKEYVAARGILEGKKSKNKRHGTNGTALLSGLLYCKCGREMRPKKRAGCDKFDYICSGKLKSGTKCCASQNLLGALADETVFSAVFKECSVTDSFFEKTAKLKDGIMEIDTKEIRDEIKDKTRKIENLIEALAEGCGYFAQRVKTEINRLEKEREILVKETEKMTDLKPFDGSVLTPEDKQAFLKNFMEKAEWDGKALHIYLFEQQVLP